MCRRARRAREDFGCWRPRCRAPLGQPRTPPAVRLGVGPRTNAPDPRRELVLRRTAGALRSPIGPAVGYRPRSLALRRTAGEYAAGPAACGAEAGTPASAEPAASCGVRSPLRPGTADARWFCAEPAASAPLGPVEGGAEAGKPASAEPAACCGVRSALRSGTAGARWFCAEPPASAAAGTGSVRSGGGKASISPAGGVLRSPIGPAVGYRRCSLVLRRTAASAPPGPASVRSGGGKASISPASAACCGVRSALRSGTAGARWPCAEPPASCSIRPGDVRGDHVSAQRRCG